MKIWIITTDQDNEGTATAVHLTEAAARGQYARIVAAAWEGWFGSKGAPMPADTAKAWEVLTMQTGYIDCVTLTEHDISDHPALKAALAAFDQMQEAIESSEDAFCNDDTVDLMGTGRGALIGALFEPFLPDEAAAAGVSDNLILIDPNEGDDPAILAAYRKAARDLHEDDGTCEFDDAATVTMGGDAGAYVQAWVWVPNEGAGIHNCDKCGVAYVEGDDSYAGLCPDCADKAEQEIDEEFEAEGGAA